MGNMIAVVLAISSYVFGSIPFGLMIVKLWKGVDIRQYGSGNIGATNVLRVAGPVAASVVLIADVLKGTIPVMVAKSLFPQYDWIPVVCGALAIFGHSLSVFLSFKGGKGVATSLGVLIGLSPAVAVVGFGIWMIVVVVTKYVSLASILACASVPFLMIVLHEPIPHIVFGTVAAIFVILRHRLNLVRLLHGKELRLGEKTNLAEGHTNE